MNLKEYSVGTSLNKYLWSKDSDGDTGKRTALWFGPRLGKRFFVAFRMDKFLTRTP